LGRAAIWFVFSLGFAAFFTESLCNEEFANRVYSELQVMPKVGAATGIIFFIFVTYNLFRSIDNEKQDFLSALVSLVATIAIIVIMALIESWHWSIYVPAGAYLFGVINLNIKPLRSKNSERII